MKRGGGEVVLEGWQLNFSPILTAGKHIPLHGLWQRTPCFLRSKTAAFSGFHLPPGRGQPGPQRAGGRPPLPPGVEAGALPAAGRASGPPNKRGRNDFSRPQGHRAPSIPSFPAPGWASDPLTAGRGRPYAPALPVPARSCLPHISGYSSGARGTKRTPSPHPGNTQAAGERFQKGGRHWRGKGSEGRGSGENALKIRVCKETEAFRTPLQL